MIVGIAGAGGIGSNVARHLVQAGIGRIRVVDFDRVEVSNLNRQFYRADQAGLSKVACLKKNLEGINPGVRVEAVERRLGPGDFLEVFKGCGIVVEGFDNAAAKKNLVEAFGRTGIPMVCASGIAGRDMDGIRSRRLGRLVIVGDFATDVADADLFPPKIAVIAAMMAGIVLDEIDRIGGNI